MKSGRVQVPMEFFRKVRRDYRNWRQATVRELIQNSVDAGATEIGFSLDNYDQTLVLNCQDNGHGMTEHVLENVFMVLGGSKKEANSLGGFGMAKMVMFSADKYHIFSGSLRVTGQGSEYTISPTEYHRTGVMVELTYGAEENLNLWQTELTAYVGLCNLKEFKPVKIFLNGKELAQNTDNFEFVNAQSGVTYELNQFDYSKITWCCQGLAMFTETYWSEGNSNINGRAELGAVDPTSTFTTNRDAFREEHNATSKQKISNLIQTHKVQTQGEVLTRVVNYSNPWSGSATRTADRVNYKLLPENFHVRIDGYAARRNAKMSNAYMSKAEASKFLESRNAGNLAHQWSRACKIVLSTDLALARGVTCWAADGVPTDFSLHGDEVGVMEHYLQGQRIEMGFGFVPGAEALCNTNAKILYLNPRETPDDLLLLDLLDLAIHEVTHLWLTNHGQDFTLLEASLRRSLRRWLTEKEIEKRMSK